MSNTVNGLLTTYGSTSQVELSYFFVVSGSGYVPNYDTSSYFFIGKVDPWIDDNEPPVPNQSQLEIKNTFKNMVAAKLLTSANMCPVVPRKDWAPDTIYDYYDDSVNMFEKDIHGNFIKQFYVRNRYDQIFKCIYNGGGIISQIEPVLKPGNTEKNKIVYLTDGYKWVYVTTIDKGLKKNFFDSNWMPLTIGQGRTTILSEAKLGSISSVNVDVVGDGTYSDGTTSTTIIITGDGEGAAAYGNVVNGFLDEVILTNAGNNYTYATATIYPAEGYTGNNASAFVTITPIGGHGSDPISELGCKHIMVSVEMNGNEDGVVPTDISFRQLGIIVNPSLLDGTTPKGQIYNLTDIVYVTAGADSFEIGETVYQGDNLALATYIAEVCSFDPITNIISLINISGKYKLSDPIYGHTSGTARVLIQYEKTDFAVGSGYMMYYENRTPVQRSENGNEQFRLVLSY